MPRRKKSKMYLVLSKQNNYRYGVFPHSEQGKKDAEKFMTNMEMSQNEKLYIIEK